jgi:signal transduction histidine kinase
MERPTTSSSEGGRVRAELESLLSFEKVLGQLSSKFINLPPGEVDLEIQDAQRRICEHLDLDLSSLWQWSTDDPNNLLLTHLYRPNGGPPVPERMNGAEHVPWTLDLIRSGKTLVFSSLDELPPEAAGERELRRRLGVRSSLTFPLAVGGEPVVGALSFNTMRADRSWPETLVNQLRTVADVFANALARKRSDRSIRNLGGRLIAAHEEERARLARDLHDDLTQRLACLAIDVASLEPHVSDPSTVVHALAYRLHPSVLTDLGLADAIRGECEQFSRQESVRLDVTLDEIPKSVPDSAALCLFRTVQEALRNVVRHAEADRVELSVRGVNGGLQVTVTDDGIGFDPELPVDRPTLGLTGIRERVHLLGGTLEIDSAPRQGTTIAVRVPLAKRAS